MKNKVTKTDLVEKIKNIDYAKMGAKTTVCVITLDNGFEVCGFSSCVDPNNFDEYIGRNCAYEDAFQKIWALEGYLLQDRLKEEAKTADYHAQALLKKGLDKLGVSAFVRLTNEMTKKINEFNA